MAADDGCTCMKCSRKYRIDLMIPDAMWALIAGEHQMFCGICIMTRLEELAVDRDQFGYILGYEGLMA